MKPWLGSSLRRKRGFTLVELVTALAISSVLLTAMGSAVMVVAKAAPNARTEALAAVEARMDWIALEVSEAVRIKAAGPRTLTIVVPDRNLDGQPEQIAYTWDGVAGSPLYRSFNGKAAEAVFTAIDGFTASAEKSSYALGMSYDIVRERYHTMTVSVTPRNVGRAVIRTANLPNGPMVLDLWARAEFDDKTDPINIDHDWSGQTDWYAGSGHSSSSIDKGWWTADSSLSVRAPGNIDVPLTVSARLQIGNTGDFATIYVMASPSGLTAAALRLKIERRSSSLRLTMEQATTVAWTKLFDEDVSIGALDVTMAVIPSRSRVVLLVNGEQERSSSYTKTAFGTSGAVQFDRSGSKVFVDWIDVRIGGTSP